MVKVKIFHGVANPPRPREHHERSIYGVWPGKIINSMIGAHNHYEIHAKDEKNEDYTIAVNCMSDDGSEVQYVLIHNFDHPYIRFLESLPMEFYDLRQRDNDKKLDYIRTEPSLFNINELIESQSVPTREETIDENNGITNTLQEYLYELTKENTIVYAVGDKWPDEDKPDVYFNFYPGRGIHNIHFKQNNDEEHSYENGKWQDGAIFFKLPNEWVALFIKFQSQRI